jgi:peptidyl-prolyl cis-trans isomerase B (cyclophilin B)
MKKILLFLAVVLSMQLVAQNEETETKVLIKTEYGNMTVILYNDTPMHRDNFIELVEKGWYNGSNFHRVIQNFMIQGGGGANGQTDPGYTTPAEFRPNHIHKKGALSAARQGDQVNPTKASSGSQFYIVQGETFNNQQLSNFSAQTGFFYTNKQKEIYNTIGGTPHLDGGYTVFGEVVDGLEVVDLIAAVETGYRDKPVLEVKMTMEIVK